MMKNWRGNLMITIFFAMILFVIVGGFIIYNKNKNCEDAGGIPTRCGCLKPDSFIK